MASEILFTSLQVAMDNESNLREVIRTQICCLERSLRSFQTHLAQVHMNVDQAVHLATHTDSDLSSVRSEIAKLVELIPDTQFFRFYPMFSNSLQTSCFLVAVQVYLHAEQLVSTNDVSRALGVPVEANCNATMTGFHIPMEDFLFALALLPSELSRLAINSAAQRDFQRPEHILNFLQRLHGGFQLLNLKNDGLRRKYDSIKYDVKRVEEVVYNIKMRGLDTVTSNV